MTNAYELYKYLVKEIARTFSAGLDTHDRDTIERAAEVIVRDFNIEEKRG